MSPSDISARDLARVRIPVCPIIQEVASMPLDPLPGHLVICYHFTKNSPSITYQLPIGLGLPDTSNHISSPFAIINQYDIGLFNVVFKKV